MITRNTPEVLYGDTATKARVYADLSRRAAAESNALLAIHFAWASDIATVQSIIWERVMIASPRPDQQFFSVATTVSKALTDYAATAQPTPDARSAVQQAREGLAGAFDSSVLRLLDQRFMTLDHLANLPHPDAAAGERLAQVRLQGGTVNALSTTKRQAAHDAMTVALGLLGQSMLDEALGQAYQADLAAFEAYLLDAATAVGDRSLVTVEMRWMLACDEIAKIPALPEDFAGAVTAIRAALAKAVSPIEADRLQERFARAV